METYISFHNGPQFTIALATTAALSFIFTLKQLKT